MFAWDLVFADVGLYETTSEDFERDDSRLLSSLFPFLLWLWIADCANLLTPFVKHK